MIQSVVVGVGVHITFCDGVFVVHCFFSLCALSIWSMPACAHSSVNTPGQSSISLTNLWRAWSPRAATRTSPSGLHDSGLGPGVLNVVMIVVNPCACVQQC